MKKRKELNTLLLLGILFGIASCDYVDYDFPDTKSENGFVRFSKTESDFLNGKGVTTLDYSEEGIGLTINTSTRTFYVDARAASGKSNWSHPSTKYPWAYENFSAGAFNYYYEEYFSGYAGLSSPPAHLHLCLNTWDENPVGRIPAKTWDVVSIKDENGQSLESDPDWSNYTDNRLRFKKTDKFVLYLGEKRTSIENDLFGTADSINGTYSVTEDKAKKVTLGISFPGYEEKFEIIESDWNSLTITGTVNDKTGTMTLSPEN